MVHPQTADASETGALDAGALRTLDLLLAELPLKTAVRLSADITGQPRNALYDAALARRQTGDMDEA
jgi:16S rRNA (cytidine1402-2'-O)-methyltransferase